MAWTRFTWVENATKAVAARFNSEEEGIEEAKTAATAAESLVSGITPSEESKVVTTSTVTLNVGQHNVFFLTIEHATEVKFTNPPARPYEVTVYFKQNGTGGYSVSFAGVKWVGGTPGFSTSANAENMATLLFKGGNVSEPFGFGSATNTVTKTEVETRLKEVATTKLGIIIGKEAGTAGPSGEWPLLIGPKAGHALTTGEYDVFIGANSGLHATSAGFCLGIGGGSLEALTTGHENYAIGGDAGSQLTTAELNLYYGNSAGEFAKGSYNVGIGHGSMSGNTSPLKGKESECTGEANTVIGTHCGYEITSGSWNIGLGCYALEKLSTGGANVAIGKEAGQDITTGSANVLLGNNAGKTLTTTSNKLMIANNETSNIIEGVMSATAASNELKLGTTGGKIAFLGGSYTAKISENLETGTLTPTNSSPYGWSKSEAEKISKAVEKLTKFAHEAGLTA